MKKGFWLIILFFLYTPKSARAELSSTQGIGICHSAASLDEQFSWSYEAGPSVQWKYLEPSAGVYNFSALDELIRSYQGRGVKIWLSLQTVAGNHAAPAWLESMGARWFKIVRSDGRDHGLLAPWDQVYLERLAIFLNAVNEHLESQSSAYQQTIGGIMMMSGGMYGEMQLWSGGAEGILISSLGLNPDNLNQVYTFRAAYYNSVLNLVDLYLETFKRWPVALQLGYNSLFIHPETRALISLDQAVVEKKVPEYGARLFLKYNGLDPTNVGDGLDSARQKIANYYRDLFSKWSSQAQVGFEIGHPWLFANPPDQASFLGGNYSWVVDRFTNIFEIAKAAKVSFVCFQTEMISGLRSVPGWQKFDEDLRAVPLPTTTLDCSCSSSAGRSFLAQADADCNSQTDLIDYNYWFEAFVRNSSFYRQQADFDCSGRAGIDDYEIWRQNFAF
ncbi:MAG: beta-galactosidase [Candidatus Shapirobacteria bacterium]